MERIDQLTEIYFNSQEQAQRTKATEELSHLTNFENVSTNLEILKETNSQFTIKFCSANVTQLFTANYTLLRDVMSDSCSQVLSILDGLSSRNFPWKSLEPLIDCYARLTKLNWFNFIPENTENALLSLFPTTQPSLPRLILITSLFSRVVADMSFVIPTILLSSQRKVSTLFRETALFQIFKYAFQTLSLFANPIEGQEERLLLSLALQLVEDILQFDFVGTIFDETTDDLSVTFIPSSWEPFFIEYQPMNIIFTIYHLYPIPISSKSLSIIELFSSTRNSLFNEQSARTAFLNTLVNGIGKILMDKKDINDPDIQHNLTRIFLRMKVSNQLKHLQETENYKAFLHFATEFSMELFRSSDSFNSIFYIVSFWSRMVTAQNMSRDSPNAGFLPECVLAVAVSFITSQMNRAENSQLDDLVESEQLDNILQEFGGLHSCIYKPMISNLVNNMKSIFQEFQQSLSSNNEALISHRERQMAWLIYIVSSVLQNKVAHFLQEYDTPTDPEVANDEAVLICYVFECLNIHDNRMEQGQRTKTTAILELSLIAFLMKFSKSYINDESFTENKIIYEGLSQKFGINSPMMIVERILQKIVTLVQKWPNHSLIVEKNLGQGGLFATLSLGWSLCKLLSKSELVLSLLRTHSEIDPGEEVRTHIKYYKAIGRLLFSFFNTQQVFCEFIQPWQTIFGQIQAFFKESENSATPPNNEVHKKFILTLHDMRGFASSIQSYNGGYRVFFEWLYNEVHFDEWIQQLFSCQSQVLQLDDMWAVVQFISEVSYQRQCRISFDPCNNFNGIKLFKSTATILMLYGNSLQRINFANKPDEKYKSLSLYSKGFQYALSGGYTSFGVFQLYNDPILNQLLSQWLTFILDLDMNELEMYPTMATQFFSAIELISWQHYDFLVCTPSSNEFCSKLFKFCYVGMFSLAPAIVNSACSAVEKILNLYLVAQSKIQGLDINRIPEHKRVAIETSMNNIRENEKTLASILVQSIHTFFSSKNSIPMINRLLFDFMAIIPQHFETVVTAIIMSQSGNPEIAQKISEQFQKLTTENMTLSDKDKGFTIRLGQLHKEVTTGSLVDLSSLYKALNQFND